MHKSPRNKIHMYLHQQLTNSTQINQASIPPTIQDRLNQAITQKNRKDISLTLKP